MFNIKDYHYDLPTELIAQQPVEQRDRSRLLGLGRHTGSLSHEVFSDIGQHLEAGDVLVVNNTAVIPGRLAGEKESGGKVEVLIADFIGGRKSIAENGSFISRCLVKASKRCRPGSWLYFTKGLKAKVLEAGEGDYQLEFQAEGDFETLLHRVGQVPLPPYIKRNSGKMHDFDDQSSYQTVYARQKGAIAAPTAGLHFTQNLLAELSYDGVHIVEITLHVGYGTFLPVRVADIRYHQMHAERYTISDSAAKVINAARANGKRVIAVGTTCVRTLEYAADSSGAVLAGSGTCDLFIYPGYRFKTIDAMVTNFHLPRSTLLILAAAFAGRSNVLNAYREAIRHGYRFYSYGDAMFIH
jgi:S-adenosylmethionine:tRNA ribosyltransferase-isomerase